MLVRYFAHLNRQLEFLQMHVLDVDQVFEEVLLLFGLPDASRYGDVELLKLVFSADQSLHLAKIFYLVDDDQAAGG